MRKQILLVDDSATVQQLVSLALADEAVDVHTAPTLQLARALLEEKTPDLILVETVLPDGDAEPFVRSLRNTPETVSTPVILLAPATAPPRTEEIPGIDSVLSKPFESMALLLSTVKDLMHRPRVVETRPLIELSKKAFDEGEHGDLILEIEDVVEVRSFDAAASARELMAALSPEILEELANTVADILLQRIENSPLKGRLDDLAKIIKSSTNNSTNEESNAADDIDEDNRDTDD